MEQNQGCYSYGQVALVLKIPFKCLSWSFKDPGRKLLFSHLVHCAPFSQTTIPGPLPHESYELHLSGPKQILRLGGICRRALCRGEKCVSLQGMWKIPSRQAAFCWESALKGKEGADKLDRLHLGASAVWSEICSQSISKEKRKKSGENAT